MNIFYYWQTNSFWHAWLFILSAFHVMIMPFIEPSMSRDTSMAGFDDNLFLIMFSFECIFISFITIDIWLDFFQRYFDITRSNVKKFVKNKKFLLRSIIIFITLLDFIIFYTSYPKTALKFSRILRPCKYEKKKIISHTNFFFFLKRSSTSTQKSFDVL
jgi:hypothetical protein